VARGAEPRGRGLLGLVRQIARDVLPTAPGPTEPIAVKDGSPLWEVPATPSSADCHAWIAADAATVHAVRHHLLHEVHADRRAVAFLSYWRHGRREC
jgi:NADPH-dependent ferric siderophore reductase